jgi:hypothetical protein
MSPFLKALQRLLLVPAFAVMIYSVTAAPALADDAMGNSRVKLDVGLGTWISVGSTTWSHNASSVSPLGNPTSKLTYTDHSTNVAELTAKLSVGPRWFGRLNIGGANIGGGRLTDDDYLTPDRGGPSSRTHSDINGSGMWYLNADAGARLLNYPGSRGTLDGFAGFQYWRQEHKAYGVRQVSCSTAGSTIDLDPQEVGVQRLCNPGAAPISNSVLAVTNTTTWYSIRTGLQTEYRVTRWLSFQGSAVLKPLSIFENRDTHHLRSDLKDPSFTMYGIGVGADLDAGAKISFTQRISLNVGYRLFWNRMLDGTWKSHGTDGGSSTFPLREMQSLRHGVTAGLNFTF